MKKQFFSYLPGIIPAMALFTSLNAQSVNQAHVPGAGLYVSNDAKISSMVTDVVNPPIINQRALNDFRKKFKHSDNAEWMLVNHGSLAKFIQNGVDTRVFYDTHGRWSSTVLTYKEDKLPKDIRGIVKSTYYDYSIYLCHEVTVGDKTAYLVSIQDDQHVKTIRVIENEMDVFEDFEKP